MADQLTTNFTHQWAGVEITENLFFEPQLEGKDLYREFQFIPDVQGKTNIYLPRKLQKVLRKDTGCGVTAAGTTTINDKTLEPCKIRLDLEQCEDEFDNTVFEKFRRSGVDRNDLTGTLIEEIMLEQTTRAIREDNQKLLWFGDDADADDFYGICDGFWRFFIDASSNLGVSIDMSNNANIEDSNGDLVEDGALVVLRQLWKEQPAVLRNIPKAEKRFYVTATIWDNYLETLEQLGTDAGLTTLQDGNIMLSFRGVRLVEMSEWDDALADVANPFNAEIGANAILYTTPVNLVIGADITNPESEIRIRFDVETELVKTRAKFIQGVQFVEEVLIGIAI